jgi:hypothetical protein
MDSERVAQGVVIHSLTRALCLLSARVQRQHLFPFDHLLAIADWDFRWEIDVVLNDLRVCRV